MQNPFKSEEVKGFIVCQKRCRLFAIVSKVCVQITNAFLEIFLKNLKERNSDSYTESDVFIEAWEISSQMRRFIFFWPTQEFSDSPNPQV
ncbi:MAG: hypothetical protein J5965_06930 [Aeriscardovia sp.]|nr:hypothetical protein [Aeriscardovia sp.]